MKDWDNPGRNDLTIRARECPDCTWLIRHPVRWCANCGTELKQVEITEHEFYEKLHRFHLETGWTWNDAKFDVHTREEESINNGERE